MTIFCSAGKCTATDNSAPFQSPKIQFFMCEHKLNIQNNNFATWKIIAPYWEPHIPCRESPFLAEKNIIENTILVRNALTFVL
jgi:hypothetical protein